MPEPRVATVAELQREGSLLVEDGNHGEYRPRSDEFVTTGVAFIRAADLSHGRVLFESASRINKRARERITKGIGKRGDVLLSHKGTVGKLALVPEDAPPFVCSPQTTFWRSLNENEIDQRYLYAFMRSPQFQAQLASRAGETDMAPYVSLTAQRTFQVVLPDITAQRSIAGILNMFDDKIELNRRLNDTLEAMARVIFRDWFVDFGPTRAKMEDRQPYLSGALWSLFPDRLTEDALPEGWRRCDVGTSFNLTMGQSPPGDTYNTDGNGLPFFQGRSDFGSRYPSSRVFCTAPSRVAYLDDTLVSVRAPVGDLNMAWEQSCVGRGVAAIRHKSESRSFTYYSMQEVQDELRQYEQSGTVFGAINKGQFEAVRTIEPSNKAVEAFEEVCSPLDGRIRLNVLESRTLERTRDFLLPKLVSGKIRPGDLEKLAGERP
jgi:type I restriction enzyme, S subunit